MRAVFKYQKPISLIVLVSLSWLCMPQLSAQAVMVTTEDVIYQDSRADYDRVRVRAFVSRNDVISHLQSYGISSGEALARVDSLTDREIAMIGGKLDQLPAGADAAGAFGSQIAQNISTGASRLAGQMALYALIAAVVIAIVILIVAYALDEGPFMPAHGKF
ncbi:MAG: PA2779 family protein [Desulfobacterales bacterium]|nr:MAG: PA2779 family protein [Desulfobacterales bacterium]